MSEAGIDVPELRCPTTPATLASTSFCATVVPTFGSAWSSSATSTNFASLPSILIFAALASSIARRAPFSLSLPRCAMPPVSGPTWPVLISMEGGGGGAACATGGFLGSSLPQPIRPIATASRVNANFDLFMGSPGKQGPNDTDTAGNEKGRFPGPSCQQIAPAYLTDRTHFTSALTSASGTAALGGIGTWPPQPCPPFLTLSNIFASASFWAVCFLATSA